MPTPQAPTSGTLAPSALLCAADLDGLEPEGGEPHRERAVRADPLVEPLELAPVRLDREALDRPRDRAQVPRERADVGELRRLPALGGVDDVHPDSAELLLREPQVEGARRRGRSRQT